MNLQKYKPLLETSFLAVLAFILHWLFFNFFGHYNENNFQYPLVVLYGFFMLCSLIIVSVLIRMKQKNIDSVGNTFMLLTCVKMVLAYTMLHPILSANAGKTTTEKLNFFAVFAIFLTIETVVSIRMLNKN